MGSVFRKRIKLFGGIGINLGKKGASVSMRTKVGSIGTKGVSVRTGIPGLSYQHRFKKQKSAEPVQAEPQSKAPVELTKKEQSIVDILFYIIIAPIVAAYIVIKFILWDWWHRAKS